MATWYLVALGVVLGVGIVAVILVAIADPTVETLTALAAAVIPITLAMIAAVTRRGRRR